MFSDKQINERSTCLWGVMRDSGKGLLDSAGYTKMIVAFANNIQRNAKCDVLAAEQNSANTSTTAAEYRKKSRERIAGLEEAIVDFKYVVEQLRAELLKKDKRTSQQGSRTDTPSGTDAEAILTNKE